jgi:hypothetical protein
MDSAGVLYLLKLKVIEKTNSTITISSDVALAGKNTSSRGSDFILSRDFQILIGVLKSCNGTNGSSCGASD